MKFNLELSIDSEVENCCPGGKRFPVLQPLVWVSDIEHLVV